MKKTERNFIETAADFNPAEADKIRNKAETNFPAKRKSLVYFGRRNCALARRGSRADETNFVDRYGAFNRRGGRGKRRCRLRRLNRSAHRPSVFGSAPPDFASGERADRRGVSGRRGFTRANAAAPGRNSAGNRNRRVRRAVFSLFASAASPRG